DLLGGASLSDQTGEGLPLAHLVGDEPGDVLDQRGFERGGGVAGLQDGARKPVDRAALLEYGARGEVAAPARDDLEGFAFAGGSDEKRHEDAARADGGQDVRHVGRSLAVAHVELGHAELAKVDVCELHDSLSFGSDRPRPFDLSDGRRAGPGYAGRAARSSLAGVGVRIGGRAGRTGPAQKGFGADDRPGAARPGGPDRQAEMGRKMQVALDGESERQADALDFRKTERSEFGGS